MITPSFMTSPDAGMRAITGCTKTGATTGVVDFYGVLPLAWSNNITGYNPPNFSNLNYATFPKYVATVGEKLGFYDYGASGTSGTDYLVIGRPI